MLVLLHLIIFAEIIRLGLTVDDGILSFLVSELVLSSVILLSNDDYIFF